MRLCLVVPHYDHVAQFRRLLPSLLDTGLPMVIVDDSSPPEALQELERLIDESGGEITLVRHEENQGKGGAVTTGLFTALDAGFTHALQIDADGQHDVAYIDALREMAAQHPDAIICGQPVFDETISKLRYYGRYLTHSLVWLETLSTEIRDAMCGFRVYPTGPVVALIRKQAPGSRMAFDPELLVRASWEGIPVHYTPVKVRYPDDGASHFHYLRDNAIISWMHIRLVFGMLLRLPLLLWRKMQSRQS
ncbi:MAG: glycosyltransferase family 2 protein [Woeseiaceae bacterium]|nr:glycosyltransferase family 2 protein [Woeseiaceae bacterium]